MNEKVKIRNVDKFHNNYHAYRKYKIKQIETTTTTTTKGFFKGGVHLNLVYMIILVV
jgi:hypothetical protein